MSDPMTSDHLNGNSSFLRKDSKFADSNPAPAPSAFDPMDSKFDSILPGFCLTRSSGLRLSDLNKVLPAAIVDAITDAELPLGTQKALAYAAGLYFKTCKEHNISPPPLQLLLTTLQVRFKLQPCLFLKEDAPEAPPEAIFSDGLESKSPDLPPSTVTEDTPVTVSPTPTVATPPTAVTPPTVVARRPFTFTTFNQLLDCVWHALRMCGLPHGIIFKRLFSPNSPLPYSPKTDYDFRRKAFDIFRMGLAKQLISIWNTTLSEDITVVSARIGDFLISCRSAYTTKYNINLPDEIVATGSILFPPAFSEVTDPIRDPLVEPDEDSIEAPIEAPNNPILARKKKQKTTISTTARTELGVEVVNNLDTRKSKKGKSYQQERLRKMGSEGTPSNSKQSRPSRSSLRRAALQEDALINHPDIWNQQAWTRFCLVTLPLIKYHNRPLTPPFISSLALLCEWIARCPHIPLRPGTFYTSSRTPDSDGFTPVSRQRISSMSACVTTFPSLFKYDSGDNSEPPHYYESNTDVYRSHEAALHGYYSTRDKILAYWEQICRSRLLDESITPFVYETNEELLNDLFSSKNEAFVTALLGTVIREEGSYRMKRIRTILFNFAVNYHPSIPSSSTPPLPKRKQGCTDESMLLFKSFTPTPPASVDYMQVWRIFMECVAAPPDTRRKLRSVEARLANAGFFGGLSALRRLYIESRINFTRQDVRMSGWNYAEALRQSMKQSMKVPAITQPLVKISQKSGEVIVEETNKVFIPQPYNPLLISSSTIKYSLHIQPVEVKTEEGTHLRSVSASVTGVLPRQSYSSNNNSFKFTLSNPTIDLGVTRYTPPSRGEINHLLSILPLLKITSSESSPTGDTKYILSDLIVNTLCDLTLKWFGKSVPKDILTGLYTTILNRTFSWAMGSKDGKYPRNVSALNSFRSLCSALSEPASSSTSFEPLLELMSTLSHFTSHYDNPTCPILCISHDHPALSHNTWLPIIVSDRQPSSDNLRVDIIGRYWPIKGHRYWFALYSILTTTKDGLLGFDVFNNGTTVQQLLANTYNSKFPYPSAAEIDAASLPQVDEQGTVIAPGINLHKMFDLLNYYRGTILKINSDDRRILISFLFTWGMLYHLRLPSTPTPSNDLLRSIIFRSCDGIIHVTEYLSSYDSIRDYTRPSPQQSTPPTKMGTKPAAKPAAKNPMDIPPTRTPGSLSVSRNSLGSAAAAAAAATPAPTTTRSARTSTKSEQPNQWATRSLSLKPNAPAATAAAAAPAAAPAPAPAPAATPARQPAATPGSFVVTRAAAPTPQNTGPKNSTRTSSSSTKRQTDFSAAADAMMRHR